MIRFNELSENESEFIENCFHAIIGNEGLPNNRQFSMNELLYDFDLDENEFLSKIVHAYMDCAGLSELYDHPDFEVAIEHFDLENYPFITLPNILDINLVTFDFAENRLKKVTINYNKQLVKLILCELAILLSNTQMTFPGSDAYNETLSEIAPEQIVYSIFHGFGFLLLYFNETAIKVNSREHYYDIVIHYHLNSDEIKCAIALWQTMYHHDYDIDQVMNEHFSKNQLHSINKMIVQINNTDEFYCERVEKTSFLFEAYNCYWNYEFNSSIDYLNNPAIYFGVDIFKKADIYFLLAENYLAICNLKETRYYFNEFKRLMPENLHLASNLYLLFIDLIEHHVVYLEDMKKYREIFEDLSDNGYVATVEPVLFELAKSIIQKNQGDNVSFVSWEENSLNVTETVLYKHYLAFWNGEKLDKLNF